MVEYLKMRPMLSCAVFAVLLSLAGLYLEWAPWIGLALIAALFLIFWARKARPASLFALCMLIPLCLSLWMTGRNIHRISRSKGTTVSGEFLITEMPVSHESFDSVTVEVKRAPPLKNGDKIRVRGRLSQFETGNIISAQITLQSIKADWIKSRYSEGIYVEGRAEKTALIEANGDPLLSGVRDLRAVIGNRLFEAMRKEEAATLSAVLTGDKTNLSEPFREAVTASGVNHIMVVSGLHLAIIAGLMLRLTRFVTRAAIARFLILVITAAFFMIFCGFTKSILRAAFCLLIYAVSLLLGRAHTPENTLGGAVVLLLIGSPFLIFSVSFQLSALSTLGILVFSLPLLRMIGKKAWMQNRFFKAVISAVLVTVGATGFALPVTLYTFGGVSAVSMLSNLLLVPVMTPMLMITVLLLPLCLPFRALAPCALWLPGQLASYTNAVIGRLGGLPVSYLYTNKTENALSILLPLFMFMLPPALRRMKKSPDRARRTAKSENGVNL